MEARFRSLLVTPVALTLAACHGVAAAVPPVSELAVASDEAAPCSDADAAAPPPAEAIAAPAPCPSQGAPPSSEDRPPTDPMSPASSI